MKKILLFILLTVLYSLNAHNQEHITSNISLDTLGVYEESGPKTELERLNMIWGPRLYPHGVFENAAKAHYNYYEKYNNKHSGISYKSVNSGSGFDPDWRCIGPTGTPSYVRRSVPLRRN